MTRMNIPSDQLMTSWTMTSFEGFQAFSGIFSPPPPFDNLWSKDDTIKFPAKEPVRQLHSSSEELLFKCALYSE